jgi:hypothetical protein
MSSIRSYGRRVGSLFAVAALALATITPGLVPSFASAAQLTERSIELTTSAKTATAVSYTVTFTPDAAADFVVFDFCSNSPLINTACTAPGGFTLADSASASGTVTDIANNTIKLALTSALVADDPETIILTGVTNPTASGPLYARIVTYTDDQNSNTPYVSATQLGTYTDNGSAAISITDNLNVSGAVLETLTFCVAGPTLDGNGDPTATTITDNCANAGSLPAPTLKLGNEVSPDVFALSPSDVSTGSLYSQLSTNAVSGAVVNLKSNALNCGGLYRLGNTANCEIAPALNTDIDEGEAKFGVRAGTATGGTGAFLPVVGSFYETNTAFAFNYVAGNGTGVTSPYGDPFLDTAGAPTSNKNLEIIFGASVAPNTPAGLYSTDLSLIATGKF